MSAVGGQCINVLVSTIQRCFVSVYEDSAKTAEETKSEAGEEYSAEVKEEVEETRSVHDDNTAEAEDDKEEKTQEEGEKEDDEEEKYKDKDGEEYESHDDGYQAEAEEEPETEPPPLPEVPPAEPPEDFRAAEFLHNLSELQEALQSERFQTLDENFPAQELKTMVRALEGTMVNFREYTKHSQEQMSVVREQAREIRDRIHKKIAAKPYDPNSGGCSSESAVQGGEELHGAE